MKRRNLFVIVLHALCFYEGVQAAETSIPVISVSAYRKSAEDFFRAKRYDEFITICRQWEALTKDFSPSYNLALGLLRVGDVQESEGKLNDIETRLVLSVGQREKLKILREDIYKYKKYYESKKTGSSGSALLMHRNQIEESHSGGNDFDISSSPNRSAAYLGLKPGHAAEYAKEYQALQLYKNGYKIPSPGNFFIAADLDLEDSK